MAKVYKKSTSRHIGVMYNWLFVALSAASTAVVVLVLGWLISQYILDPLLCRKLLSSCGSSDVVAGNIAAIIGGVIGTILLLRLGVRRAIIPPVAVVVLTWGLTSFYRYMLWPESVISLIAIYTLGYVLFVWISRIRSLIVTLLVSVIVVVLLRLILLV